MYQLYAYPNTYAIGTHLLLEETGVAYEIINPKLNPALTDQGFYRASPHGRVPALILPNGTTVCESGAIMLHLADHLSDGEFSVKPQAADRTRYLQWLFYLSSTLQPEVMIIFHPEFYFEHSDRQKELTLAAHQRLKQIWSILDQEYKSGPWMFSHGPTAIDLALANVLVWPECFASSLQDHPRLCSMLEKLSERPSWQRIMPWHSGNTSQVPAAQLAEGSLSGK